jgi:hypothetical protein
MEEKRRQVAIMGHIFSKAVPVIIWLGPEEDKSDEALEVLRLMGRSVKVNWANCSMRSSEACTASDTHFADISAPLPYRNGALAPMLDLFERDYFKRVWIKQEVALANYAFVYCGSKQLGYDIKARFPMGMSQHGNLRAHWFITSSH